MSSVTFQDAAGNPIANGTMVVYLNADAKHSSGEIHSQPVRIALDSTGTADTTTFKVLSGLSNNYDSDNAPSYSVIVYSATGERVFGPSSKDNPTLPSPLQ
jgi:hypothetical protein